MGSSLVSSVRAMRGTRNHVSTDDGVRKLRAPKRTRITPELIEKASGEASREATEWHGKGNPPDCVPDCLKVNYSRMSEAEKMASWDLLLKQLGVPPDQVEALRERYTGKVTPTELAVLLANLERKVQEHLARTMKTDGLVGQVKDLRSQQRQKAPELENLLQLPPKDRGFAVTKFLITTEPGTVLVSSGGVHGKPGTRYTKNPQGVWVSDDSRPLSDKAVKAGVLAGQLVLNSGTSSVKRTKDGAEIGGQYLTDRQLREALDALTPLNAHTRGALRQIGSPLANVDFKKVASDYNPRMPVKLALLDVLTDALNKNA